MKKALFTEIKNKIYRYVNQQRFREAFSLARSLSEGAMEWEISDTLSTAEDSYRRLLSYAVSGAEDPGREALTREIGETILTITDRLERRNTAHEEPTLYYSILRYQRTQPGLSIAGELGRYRQMLSDNSMIDILAAGSHTSKFRSTTSERELAEREIFNLIWTAFPLSRADYDALSDAFTSGVLPPYAVGLFAWGVIMGGLEFYDPLRLMLLCNLYADGSEKISAIALIGLLIVMYRWRNRGFSKKLEDRFASLRELPGWREDVKAAYMELTRTRDTDRITAKIRDEIVPEMMKMRPDFERKLQNPSEPVSPEEMEENPQWQELLDKSGLSDKLKEMSEIQEEGGDVMMGTFSQLKQFPFFNEMANWFLPFHNERSEFSDPDLQKIANMFEALKFLCDSDKYSMMMSLSHVPAQQRQLMLGQLNAQAEQFEQMRASSLDLPSASRREVIARQVQNMYRFFRLFRRKGEYYNPFAEGVNLAAVPALVEDVKDPELLGIIAEFYFHHGYWQEALDVFEKIDTLSAPSASVYQKMGHSLLKLGRTSEALGYFEKADMLDNRSAWTLRRLGRCYAATGNYNSALSAYQRLEELTPDLPATAIAIGRCHLALDHYPEAVKAFYKAFYLDEKSGKAIRPLAWSLLMDKQFDLSRKYYEKILTDFDQAAEDYLNLGHLSLATGNFPEARNFYKLNILSRPKPAGASGSGVPAATLEAFIADMRADTPALRHLGVDPSLVPLITDSLLYSLT